MADPIPCPRCGEACRYAGWGHAHSNGAPIGSCGWWIHRVPAAADG